jgi:CTP synthase (UTP-ammonia lyase)
MGIADAGHAEYDPNAPSPLIVPVSCAVPNRAEGAPSLSGDLVIAVQPGTLAYRVLQRAEIREDFFCNYELNPDFQDDVQRAGLQISGRGERGEARLVELPDHRFYLASLFLPQHTSQPEAPHPLVTAFLAAARDFRRERSRQPAGRG